MYARPHTWTNRTEMQASRSISAVTALELGFAWPTTHSTGTLHAGRLSISLRSIDRERLVARGSRIRG